MAETLVKMVVENATKLLRQNGELLWGVEGDVRKLQSTLSIIQGYLRDVEEKELKKEAVRSWLQQLKDIAYELDDILDEYATEVMQMEDRHKSMNCLDFILSKLNLKHLVFRLRIAMELKDAQGRLDGITSTGNKFGLPARVADGRAEFLPDRVTGFVVDERKVYGREEDKEKIVKCLMEDAANSGDLFVYPILGEGGLGKTTLAQMIFNDDKIKDYFEPIIWVCVPEQSPQGGDNVAEDFNVKAVISAIIRFVSGNQSEALDLAGLQMEVQQLLKKKRYLLILDDVWNLNEDKWNELRTTLTCGSKGASVVTTTRLKEASEIMGTFKPHYLSRLKHGDCWLLFKQQAFKKDEVISQSIKEIADEIVGKCKGVPLVAKTLGGLLRSERSESKWKNIRDTELWRLSNAKKSILPILRLSYWNLPRETKQCFAFCSIFPKDSEINKKLLIRLWEANGFISSSETSKAAEHVGDQICNELVFRSLFQVSIRYGDNILGFKMHDLVHDLAQSILQDECLIFYEGSSYKVEKRIRHMNLQDCSRPASILSTLEMVESIRTLIINYKAQYVYKEFDYKNFGDSFSFSKFQRVRAVVARSTILKTLSPSIGNLKYLRHLDFSYSTIEVLPDTICDLLNLQTLHLTYCKYLQRLPDRMMLLKNLWDLLLDGCWALKSTPPRLREITGLRTLGLFVVQEKEGCGLSELEELNLKGKLHIKHLERVRNSEDAEKAHMRHKKDLCVLVFSWDGCCESSNNLQVLKALEPHRNLEVLEIRGYKGASLPLWMGDPIYDKLVSIELDSLENFLQLSLLGKLPYLKKLAVNQMECMKYIDDEVHGEGTTIFPSLEDLEITSSENLERLSVHEEGEIFPRLTTIYISRCPKLTLPRLPSLKELKAHGVDTNSFLVSISNLSNLTRLFLYSHFLGIDKRISLPGEIFINLTSLRSLKIQWFTTIEVPSNSIINLTALEDLWISGCSELVDFPALGPLTRLQSLLLRSCKKLRSLPTDIQDNTTLTSLKILRCPELKKRYNKENGEDWHKISHIPFVHISH